MVPVRPAMPRVGLRQSTGPTLKETTIFKDCEDGVLEPATSEYDTIPVVRSCSSLGLPEVREGES